MNKVQAEDLAVDTTIELGSFTMEHDAIVDFARQWDPQPFHLDDEFAASHHFGEIIASGMHTLAVYQRLSVLGVFRNWDVIAGRALRDVQLTLAVRPGMTLNGRLTITKVEMVDDDRALVTTVGRLLSEGRAVLTLTSDTYVRRHSTANRSDGRRG